MKYFIGRGVLIDCEVTREFAWSMYIIHAGTGGLTLFATPNFNKGARVGLRHYDLWGENISNAECFQRRLAGKLATGIKEIVK